MVSFTFPTSQRVRSDVLTVDPSPLCSMRGACDIVIIILRIFNNVLSFGRTVFEAEGIAVTANLNVNYKKFVPLDSTKKIEAKIDRVEGKKVFVSGKIVDPIDGTVHSEGTALFIKYDYSKHANQNKKD